MEDEDLVMRVRAEFRESPGLCLTLAQAARLWGLDRAQCRRIVDLMVAQRELRWTSAGMLTRVQQ